MGNNKLLAQINQIVCVLMCFVVCVCVWGGGVGVCGCGCVGVWVCVMMLYTLIVALTNQLYQLF